MGMPIQHCAEFPKIGIGIDGPGGVGGQVQHDPACIGGDRGFKLVDIHAQAVVAIDENWLRAYFANGADRGPESIGAGYDLIARFRLQRLQRDFQRIGARAHADSVLDTQHRSEGVLEVRDNLAEREVAGFHQRAKIVEYFLWVGVLLWQR